MSSDLQRLCEAAKIASNRDDLDLTDPEVEAIVRAVLTALREPSEKMREAADRFSWVDDGLRRESWSDEHRTMIDHILAESKNQGA